MTEDGNGDSVRRWVFGILSVSIFLVSLAAFLLGSVFTLFALSPGTDMMDANVLIREAPPYAFGGVVGLVIARVLWRRRGARQPTPDPEV